MVASYEGNIERKGSCRDDSIGHVRNLDFGNAFHGEALGCLRS